MFFASLLLASSAACGNPTPHTFKEHAAECRGGSAPNAGKFRPITPAERAKVQRAFNRVLKDGPSTRWQIEGALGSFLVCGYLNSKNSYGAYSGWVPFTYSFEMDQGGTHEDNGWFFETLCHNITATP